MDLIYAFTSGHAPFSLRITLLSVLLLPPVICLHTFLPWFLLTYIYHHFFRSTRFQVSPVLYSFISPIYSKFVFSYSAKNMKNKRFTSHAHFPARDSTCQFPTSLTCHPSQNWRTRIIMGEGGENGTSGSLSNENESDQWENEACVSEVMPFLKRGFSSFSFAFFLPSSLLLFPPPPGFWDFPTTPLTHCCDFLPPFLLLPLSF